MFAFRKTRAVPVAAPEPAPAPAPGPDGLIDVKALIARYSNAEHVARADAYFAGIADDDKLLRKPFFGIADTHANMHGVAEMLQLLRLFPGVRVLDFGAGTGWFSRMLAFLECEAIAVDVSARALGLGERAFARDPVAAGLTVAWRPFDGVRVPAEDGSVDRVVCYDSFHHVADQRAMLREFHRVLAEGGRAVFHEPGPAHSKIPISQYEMRHHDVIENDIVVEDIWRLAREAGFTGIEMALTAPRTPVVPLDQYARVIAGDATLKDAQALLRAVVDGAANLRIFALAKGEDAHDSRHITGLSGIFEVALTETDGPVLRGRARVTNTGLTVWRPSTMVVGGVWLGVQHRTAAAQADFGRVWLSDSVMLPGQTMEVEIELAAPVERPARIAFDLVAEGVTWFELIGSTPVCIDLG